MGCQGSKSLASDSPPPALTEDMKKKVRESWDWFLSDENLSTNGVLIFVKMFEVAPKAKAVFSFVGDSSKQEELLANEKLQKHARRVTEAISTVVSNLDDQDVVSQAVNDLGARHRQYGAKPEYLEAVAQGVMHALKTTLESRLTADHGKAWQNALAVIKHIFLKGLTSK